MVELIAKRYGSAIFELALEKDAVAQLKDEILAIRDSFLDHDLQEMLTHPKIALEKKYAFLEEALDGKISDELLGLLILVIRKRRQSHIPEILEQALELVDAYEGKVKAFISSPDALSDQQKDMIVTELSKQTDKEIIPVYEVDASLIGGLVVRIGDRIMDNSIKGHLHTLSRQLLETKINI